MRNCAFLVLAALLTGIVGCGDNKPPLNLTPMTVDQKQKVMDEDRQIFEAEGGKPRPQIKQVKR